MKKRGKTAGAGAAPGSYDEIARRHQGERTTAARVAGRRAGQAAPGEAEGGRVTDVSPEDITEGAIEIGRARGRLGVPAIDGEGLRALAARVDGNVGYVTPIVGGLVEAFPKVAELTGETREALDEALQQRTEMLELRGTATQLRADVTDTRRQTSGALRADLKALVAAIREQLRPGRLPKQEQDRLRSDTLELMTTWEQVERAPVAEREKTELEGRAHEEAIAEETEKAEFARTMLALQSGEVVDQAEWDRAAARYDQLSAGGAAAGLAPATANRRTRGR